MRTPEARTENFPLSTQYWVIRTDWGDKLRTSSLLRNPREICDANYRTAEGMGPMTGHRLGDYFECEIKRVLNVGDYHPILSLQHA